MLLSRSGAKILLRYFVFAYLGLTPGVAFAGLLYGSRDAPHTIKVPKGLERDVKFWEDVFGRYHSGHCVVHDSRQPWRIYQVYNIKGKSRKAQNRSVARSVRQVKNTLRRLAKGQKMRNASERRIARRAKPWLRSKKSLRRAVRQVRCQRGVADSFRKGLTRSKRYLPMIRRELSKRGLPKDLAYLPHLESGFNNRAWSKAGARGLWQLMPATARPKLRVGRHRDDRVNPRRATRFALDLLKQHYRRTGSWGLALTGYNYGINGVMRAIRRHKTNDYLTIRRRHSSPIFRFAAKNFFAEFLAVRNLARRAEKRVRLAGL